MAEAKAPEVYTSRGHVEGEDWPGVAAAVNARMAARRVGQQELAELSGVSVSTLRQVQHSAGRRVQNKTLAAISRALDWPDDHLTAVLLAGTQQSQDHSTPAVGGDQVLDALHRLEHEVRVVRQQLADLTAAISERPQPR